MTRRTRTERLREWSTRLRIAPSLSLEWLSTGHGRERRYSAQGHLGNLLAEEGLAVWRKPEAGDKLERWALFFDFDYLAERKVGMAKGDMKDNKRSDLTFPKLCVLALPAFVVWDTGLHHEFLRVLRVAESEAWSGERLGDLISDWLVLGDRALAL